VSAEEEVELLSCPQGCGCLWAADWPYDKCSEDHCWCETQNDPWWHTSDLVVWAEYQGDGDGPEDIAGANDETQKIPEVKE
jgi:hypothetical protein